MRFSKQNIVEAVGVPTNIENVSKRVFNFFSGGNILSSDNITAEHKIWQISQQQGTCGTC